MTRPGNGFATMDVQPGMKLRRDRLITRQISPLLSGVLAVNLLGVVLIACSAAGGQSPAPSPLDIQGMEWRAVSVAGRAPVAPHIPTIKLDGARAGGNAGCNTYGADVAITGTTITVNQLMQTEMACADPNAMAIEGTFVTTLAAATTVEIRDGKLVIGGPGGELVFESAS